MGFIIKYGPDVDRDYMARIFSLDEAVYEGEYVGILENLEKRYDRNPDTFVIMEDEETGDTAGYICFLPCGENLYNDLRFKKKMRDDDIEGYEMADYSENENHLFIISVVIAEKYRGKEAVLALKKGFTDRLNKFEEEGFPITDILAVAVSEDGEKFLRDTYFIMEDSITETEKLYVCEDAYLHKLLTNGLYRYSKTYKDDIYIMLPLVEHKKNWRLRDFISSSESQDGTEGIPKIPQKLIGDLNDCLKYECSNRLLSDLRTIYFGEFEFVHTDDNYSDGTEVKNVVGIEKAYAILSTHLPTHMYTLTLMIPDCKYSSTQVLDQLSTNHVLIRDPDNTGSFVSIYDYLHRKYALFKCGEGKCFLYLSNKPEDPQELKNILAAEVYNSIKVDYRIQSQKIDEMASTDHSQYDYYDVYLSERVSAFIAHDFSDDVLERIETASTYTFIIQLIIFQQTSLVKNNIKISKALSKNGDISHEVILELYQDFGRSRCFWETENFNYRGAQYEAEAIAEAFGNEKIKETYSEIIEYLEQIVNLKSALTEEKNGSLLNIFLTVLAVIQVQSFAVEVLESLYSSLGIDAVYANTTFSTGVLFGGTGIFIIYTIMKRRKNRLRKNSLRF